MNNIRYVILTDYTGPRIKKAFVRTVDGQWYKAEAIVVGKKNVSFGFPLEDTTALLELQLNRKFYLDATKFGAPKHNALSFNEEDIHTKGDYTSVAVGGFISLLILSVLWSEGMFSKLFTY